MKKYIFYAVAIIWFLGFLTIGGRLGEPLLKSVLEPIYGVDVECEYHGRVIDYCYSLGEDSAGVAYLPQIMFFVFIGIPVVVIFLVLGIGEHRLKKRNTERGEAKE